MSQRDTTGWLPNLLGPTEFQVNGAEQSVPKRDTINFIGGVTVSDNTANDSTDITFAGGGAPAGAGIATVSSGVFDTDATGYGDLAKVSGVLRVTSLLSAAAIAVATALSFGANPASTGVLRLANTSAINARNAANNADVAIAQVNSSNQVLLGDTGFDSNLRGASNIYLTLGVTVQATISSGAIGFNRTQATTINILDETTAGATGKLLTVKGQNTTGTGTTTSGGLTLSSGSSSGATIGNTGNVALVVPSPSGTGAAGAITGSVAGVSLLSLGGAAGDFLKLGAPTATGSAYASAGLIRVGDVIANAVSIIAGRNTANTANTNVVSSDGAGNLFFGDTTTVGRVVFDATTLISMRSNSGSTAFQVSGTDLISYGLNRLFSQTNSTYSFESDSTLTTWNFNINTTNIVSITSSKFITKKGRNRALTRGATSVTLTTSHDIYIFSATGQTATLPTSPSVGDKYTVGIDIANVADTFAIAGPSNSIVYNGTTYTTLTVTTTTSSPNAVTLCWTGAFWLAVSGY